jgi:hypothetical protein
VDAHLAVSQVQEILGLSGVYQITTLRGYRTDDHGQVQHLRIELWDAGPTVDFDRYSVAVEDVTPEGEQPRLKPKIMGDAAASIEAALAILGSRLSELDKQPQPL